MREVESFQVQVREEGKLIADFHVDEKKRCRGLVVGTGDAHAQIVITSDSTYQKGDEDYWSQNAEKDAADFIAAVSGRWAKSPQVPQLAALCDLEPLLDEVSELENAAASDLAVGAVRSFNGQEVVAVASGSAEAQGEILIEIAPPHRWRSISGDSYNFVFSEFNKPVAIDVPGPGEYVDISELLGP